MDRRHRPRDEWLDGDARSAGGHLEPVATENGDAAILSLHRSAGNRAVRDLLRGGQAGGTLAGAGLAGGGLAPALQRAAGGLNLADRPVVQRDGPDPDDADSATDGGDATAQSADGGTVDTEASGTAQVTVPPTTTPPSGPIGQAAQEHADQGGGSSAAPTDAGSAAPANAQAPAGAGAGAIGGGAGPTPATGGASSSGAASTAGNMTDPIPVGVDVGLGGTAVPLAYDQYQPGGGSGPYRLRGGGVFGAGDYSASVSGALVFRGRFLHREGNWHFVYEPSIGGSVSLSGMTTDDGRVRASDAVAVAVGADMIHWGSGRVDLHMLNTSFGLGWNMTTGASQLTAAVSPFGIEWHMLPNVSVMVTLPVQVAVDPSSGSTGVTFGPTITFTGNVRQGGPPGG